MIWLNSSKFKSDFNKQGGYMLQWLQIGKQIFDNVIGADGKVRAVEKSLEDHTRSIGELRDGVKKVQAMCGMLILLTSVAMVLSIVAIVMAIKR
jgi:hypothetical protein